MRCIGIVDRSHDFKSFQFMAEEPTLFFYKPGQFVTLELNIEGKRILRSYTISSSPSRPHLIEISVKRVKGGLVSNYLHDHMSLGDSVVMKPPVGKFHCFRHSGRKVSVFGSRQRSHTDAVDGALVARHRVFIPMWFFTTACASPKMRFLPKT
jgi:ferredoxin-NADP reductase